LGLIGVISPMLPAPPQITPITTGRGCVQERWRARDAHGRLHPTRRAGQVHGEMRRQQPAAAGARLSWGFRCWHVCRPTNSRPRLCARDHVLPPPP
jgi:hypothetical protein